MATRLLVTGAGTGASNNLIRGLRAGEPSLLIVGCHHDRFFLRKSPADRNYLIPAAVYPEFLQGLRRVIRAEGIDLLIPTNDADVAAVARVQDKIPCHLFLPQKAVIELCQDKYQLATLLQTRGISAPLTHPVTDLNGIEEVFQLFAPRSLLWCRIRTGSGSMGAIPVKNPEQARNWISYWEEMRGVPPTSFILSEYLPGRDFFCQGLWNRGKLILIKTCQRLSYFTGGSDPSGVSSVSALAKTVFEPRLVDVCTAAARAIDPHASGVFNFDLKENTRGIPCVTEINAGRFASGSNILDLAGKHNMAVTYVRLALGEPVDVRDEYDVAEDYYSVRDLDTFPGIFHAEEFFDGIIDARGRARRPTS